MLWSLHVPLNPFFKLFLNEVVPRKWWKIEMRSFRSKYLNLLCSASSIVFSSFFELFCSMVDCLWWDVCNFINSLIQCWEGHSGANNSWWSNISSSSSQVLFECMIPVFHSIIIYNWMSEYSWWFWNNVCSRLAANMAIGNIREFSVSK